MSYHKAKTQYPGTQNAAAGMGNYSNVTHYQPPVQRLHAYGVTQPAYGRKLLPNATFGPRRSEGLSGILAVL